MTFHSVCRIFIIWLAATRIYGRCFVTGQSGVTRKLGLNNLKMHKSESTVTALRQKDGVAAADMTRRSWLAITSGLILTLSQVRAVNAEAIQTEAYNNPNIPAGPEERSGLVVLRVAEVASFQEKILRAVANGDLEYTVSPQQIAFGTQILMRNSNLDGNMKLMIYTEIPRGSRDEAIKNAVKTMNTLQTIMSTAAEIQRPLTKEDLLQFAEMYREVRLQLNDMYEYLPSKEKSKYYGYFMAVTEYEKKIAEGTYNPDTDGILKLDY